MKKATIIKLISAVAANAVLLASCAEVGNSPVFISENRVYSCAVENCALAYYVDANTSKSGDGSKTSPFSTIAEARDAIRSLKASAGLPDGGIAVYINPGEYNLAEGLSFAADDSGTEACPIYYVSTEEYGAVLTGGLMLKNSDFTAIDDSEKSRLYDSSAAEKILKIDLTKYGLTSDDWGTLYAKGAYNQGSRYENGTGDPESELFFNGARMSLARYPSEGFLNIVNVIDNGDALETYDTGEKIRHPEYYDLTEPRGGTFAVDEETKSHIAAWSTISDVWVFGYFNYDWADASSPVKAINIDESSVTLAYSSIYSYKKDARYYFYNVFEELDAPGEYYIDRDNGILYFYPPKGFDSAEIMLSVSKNNIISADSASYLTFKGFSVCGTRSDAVSLNNCSYITIDDCNISDTRLGAISATGTNITIQNCEISRTGTFGVNVTGGDRETLTSSENLIYNNKIHNWSEVVQTYQAAIGMFGCGNTASHNEIYNAPHMAITYSGNNNIIEYNEIYNVCTDTSDCGAVYAGRAYDWCGTIIRYNFIHEVGTGDASADGIYFDDNLSGQTVYGNILMNVVGHALLIGGGRDIIVYNNIMINCGTSIKYDIRGREGIFYGGWYGNLLNGSTETARLSEMPYTGEIWSAAYPNLAKAKLDLSTTDKDDPDLLVNPSYGIVKNNAIYSDKKNKSANFEIEDDVYKFSDVENNKVISADLNDFRGADNGDFTLRENSKLISILPDFEPIPFDEIGLVK